MRPSTRLRRGAALALLAATGLALANLPTDDLPAPWLIAFTLPGALLGLWARGNRAAWQRALLAVVLQAIACYAALLLAGPMTRPAALACTILPPLAFTTARNLDEDPSLPLFLGFCVLLVGIILDAIDVPLLLGYGTAALLSLHLSTQLDAYRCSQQSTSTSARRHTRAGEIATFGSLLVGCLLAVVSLDRTIEMLPSPSTAENGANAASEQQPTGNRRTGLDDSFLLDGASGTLSEMNGEQLLRATSVDDRPLPEDLYFRCGFFAEASLEEWRVGPLSLQDGSEPDGHEFARITSRDAPRRMILERYAGARRFVFLPPGTARIEGLDGLRVDPLRRWARTRSGGDADYIATVPTRPVDRARGLDPRGRQLGMLQLVPGYDVAPFERLMERWGVGSEPRAAMRAISRGLAQHCVYERREPTGPFPHALENFLFADEDRHGYCMHFAAAAALMLRLRGIPCRVAVGLYGGEADRRDDASRTYGSQHAHAWVEVMHRRGDFVVYDPTPADMRARGWLPTTREDSPFADDGDDAAGADANGLDLESALDVLRAPWPWLTMLTLALGFALLPRRAPRRPDTQQPKLTPELRHAMQRLLKTLARAGLPRQPRQTIEQFARALHAGTSPLPEATADTVTAALTAYQEVRFGGREFGDDKKALLHAAITAVEETAVVPAADQRTARATAGQR